MDPAVPLEESLGELARLREEGKILSIGLSNVSGRQLDEALRLTRIAAVQNRCNVLDTRDFDSGLVEHCRSLGIAYVAYSPVGGHSGHLRLDQQPTLARIASKHGTTPYVVALAWLLARGPHVIAIPGASRVASIESSLTATSVQLDDEDMAALTALGSRNRKH